MSHHVTISLSRQKMQKAGIDIQILHNTVEITFTASEEKFAAMQEASLILAEAAFSRPDIDQLLDELIELDQFRLLMRLRA